MEEIYENLWHNFIFSDDLYELIEDFTTDVENMIFYNTNYYDFAEEINFMSLYNL